VGIAVAGVTQTVTDHTMTGRPNPDSCARPPAKYGFVPTDARAYQWTFVSGARRGDVVRWEWIQPDGSLYRRASLSLSYRGRVCFWDWIAIAGQPAATLPGNWSVKVYYNGARIVTEIFTIRSAPTIITQPQSQTVSAGTDVTFSVVATGIPPPRYQWRFNGRSDSTSAGSCDRRCRCVGTRMHTEKHGLESVFIRVDPCRL